MLLTVLQACIERTDSGVSGRSAAGEEANLGWVKAGEFGGNAEEITRSSDPWEMRFENGKFNLLSGICATEDEVWACDLEISRIQVFDLDGNHKRNIGLGCPIEGTLPSLRDIFIESTEKSVRDTDYWEDISGNTWRSRKHELFKVSDVEVVPDGYYVADWVKTSMRMEPLRDFEVYFVSDDSGILPIQLEAITFPTYLAVEYSTLAVSDPTSTSLWTAYMNDGNWKEKTLASGIDFKRYMTLEEYFSESQDYLSMLYRFSYCGQGNGEYTYIGGLDIAFEKLVVCDTGNRRLQVMSMVTDVDWKFGKYIRAIQGFSSLGEFRFKAPLDISIAGDGTMFVLDVGEIEVAVLDAGFNRIGAFGKGDLIEPYAIDLSDDGKHCYISDRRYNTIHHYALSD